jgi:hypothetical protein
MYFSKLVKHEEKGKRINQLRNSLYQYLSLDPHTQILHLEHRVKVVNKNPNNLSVSWIDKKKFHYRVSETN